LEKLEGRSEMIGSHPTMRLVQNLIEKVAPTSSTVLIQGETGTGKELVARAVHAQSTRGDKPFVAVNCAALPEQLIESELFGHRKGAFTGADQNRTGLFEVADGGTLFLDEIGELPKAMQSKLLRVLESGEVRRVGDNQDFQVDVRIVAATHRDLAQMVRGDQFREDLMYRINTFEIPVPPLRERAADIPQLAIHLLRRLRADALAHAQPFSGAALEALGQHAWPGNVRELANAVERASILCDRLPIGPEHLPHALTGTPRLAPAFDFAGKSLRDLEWIAIQAALGRHSGNKLAAADELGISLKTLYSRLNDASDLRKAA
jgi:two-component system NtrC family response regulator